jgi:gliding motility-associated-like protein
MFVVKRVISMLLNVWLMLLFSTVIFGQESQLSGMQGSNLNFYSFSDSKVENLNHWLAKNKSEFFQHPEFGRLPYNSPCQNCVEDLSKRTASSRFFVDLVDRNKFYQQNAYGDLHFFRNGYWLTIDPQLKPQEDGTYAALSQLDPVSFNTNIKSTTVQTPQTQVTFNQWHLIGLKNGIETYLGNANWTDYTAGDDGMQVRNIFPGIDAQFITARGSVKTNFIVKQIAYEDFDELIFRDNFSASIPTKLTFKEHEGNFGVGNLWLSSNETELVEIEQAVLYPVGGEKEYNIDLPYKISQNTMDVVVPVQILSTLLEEFGTIIIDPLVTSSNTLAQASITGSMYNASCNFTNSCDYNLTLATPANATFTDVRWSFNYVTSGSCRLNDGALKFGLGSCISPAANNFFWFCNSNQTGTCNGNNISVFNDLGSCLPAPSCSPQNVTFTLKFYRRCVGSTGCNNACIGANSPWTMVVEGRTIEYTATTNQITVSSTSVCAGQSITASTSTQNGVPPYSYNWSFSPSGSPSVGTGASTSITFPNPGTVTLYSIVTDACGNQITVNRNITVNAAPVITATPNPVTRCTGQATGIGLTSSMSNTSYSWTVVQSGVTGASNGSAAGGGGGTSPYTINQTLTNSGTTPGTATYTITPTAGGCPGQQITVIVTVNPNNTVSAASSSPTVCVNTAISPVITHTTTGATGIGTATGLPAGVTANWSGNTITISGTPTATGSFNYSIPLTGGCGTVNATGTITVISVNTVSAASSSPTLCVNTAISPVITHTTTGATGIGTATGLPAGVTVNWSSNTITISGTPSASGTFNYSIPLTGGCGTVNATGTITVNPINTVGTASSSPTLCVNTAISPVITHSTTGATDIGTPTGLPAGVTASWAANTITISGTPTSPGTYNYTIPLTGGCGTVNATGTITVNPVNTVSAASSSPTVCVNTAISPVITHTTTGATGIGTATGLPAGVTANWSGNTITISGTPTAPGTFNYSIPLTGGCGTVNATGSITVNPNNTVSAPSSTPTLCVNTAINPAITHTTTGTTGIGTPTGLPAGANASWTGNTITISGTPTASGTFNYTIPLTGGCGTVNATGTITVNPIVTPTFEQVGPYCSGQAIPALPTTSQNGITGNWSPAINNLATTTYTFTPTAGQCAAQTTMQIQVNDVATTTETETACDSFTWNGTTYTSSGTYTFTSVNAEGCENIATLNLTINNSTSSNETEVACDSFTWNGTTYTNSGVYTFTTTNVAGCIHVATLDLTVNYSTTSTETEVACNEFIWNGTTYSQSGTYTHVSTNADGCTHSATLNLTVSSEPVASFSYNGPYCANAPNALPVLSPGAQAGTFSATPNGLSINAATGEINISLSSANTYTVTNLIPASNGCPQVSSTATITINPIPLATISGAANYCAGNPLNPLTLNPSGGGSYTWYADANLTQVIGNNATIQPATIAGSITYYGTVTVNGCTSLPANATVTINPLPSINAGSDQTVCEGQTVVLNATGGANYQWDNGVINAVGFVQNTGTVTYTVTGTDHNGCQNTDQVVVTVVSSPVPSFTASPNSGCSPLDVVFTNTTPGNLVACNWNFGNGTTSSTCGPQSIQYTGDGCFNVTLTVTYQGGCSSTTTLPNAVCLDAPPTAQFTFTPETGDANQTIVFVNNSENASTYLWEFGDLNGTSTEINPEYAYEETGNYLITLVAYSENGCTDTTSKLIVIKEDLIFYVPNAFTPDGNKHNETFLPIFTSGFDIYGYNLLIFNRWGEVVFESNNAAVGWNGTYGGEIAPEGVYVWQIKVKVLGVDKPQIHRGHVNLLR